MPSGISFFVFYSFSSSKNITAFTSRITALRHIYRKRSLYIERKKRKKPSPLFKNCIGKEGCTKSLQDQIYQIQGKNRHTICALSTQKLKVYSIYCAISEKREKDKKRWKKVLTKGDTRGIIVEHSGERHKRNERIKSFQKARKNFQKKFEKKLDKRNQMW